MTRATRRTTCRATCITPRLRGRVSQMALFRCLGDMSTAAWLDDRLNLSWFGRRYLRKVFPEHWSFMLGEIALWSFVVLLVTGVFLTFWFTPSMAETTYEGSYDQLRGVSMSEAYA